MSRSMRILTGLVVPIAWLLGSCEGVTQPEYGQLRVSLVTTGGDVDLDGYLLAVDETAPRLVTVNGTEEIGVVSVGVHVVALEGVADNCEVGDNPQRSVRIQPERSTEIAFAVTCYTTGIEFATVTTGLDFGASGYFLLLGGGPPQLIAANGIFLKSRLTPGNYSVAVTGLNSNCSHLVPPPPTVQVSLRQVTGVTLSIRCLAVTGVVEVTVVTSGIDPDPNGYLARVVTVASRQVPVNTITRFEEISAGAHLISLEDVASNCIVQGQNPQPTQVAWGGPTRDTVRVRFVVVCARIEKIAFVQGTSIAVAYADGSNAIGIANGSAPDWSPNGSFLVFESRRCSSLANYGGDEPPTDPCVELGLALAGLDGTVVRTLTSNISDRNPAWAPNDEYDLEFIAFDRAGELRLVRVDGALNFPLPTPAWASQPAWAPSGTRIAFTCEVAVGNLDICSINSDGSGFQRLTSDPARDIEPAWSPDGTRIAFTTTRFTGREDIALLDVSEGNVVRVVAGSSSDWSGDGGRLIFTISGLGLAIVNPDGTGLMIISRQGEYAPAWRP